MENKAVNTPQKKQYIDTLDDQLAKDVETNQQHIANVGKDDPDHQRLYDILVASQRRRCEEPNTRTLDLLEEIVRDNHLDWDEAVKRNNDAQQNHLKGGAWVKAIIDGLH